MPVRPRAPALALLTLAAVLGTATVHGAAFGAAVPEVGPSGAGSGAGPAAEGFLGALAAELNARQADVQVVSGRASDTSGPLAERLASQVLALQAVVAAGHPVDGAGGWYLGTLDAAYDMKEGLEHLTLTSAVELAQAAILLESSVTPGGAVACAGYGILAAGHADLQRSLAVLDAHGAGLLAHGLADQAQSLVHDLHDLYDAALAAADAGARDGSALAGSMVWATLGTMSLGLWTALVSILAAALLVGSPDSTLLLLGIVASALGSVLALAMVGLMAQGAVVGAAGQAASGCS